MPLRYYGIKKMRMIERRWFCFRFIICLYFLVSACALSAQRTHSEFNARIKTVENPVLIPSDFSMLELLPSGMVIRRDDWSETGRNNLQYAILSDLKAKKCNLKPLEIDPQAAEEMAEIQALYRLVHKTMQQQTFNPHQSSNVAGSFDFSLGPIDSILHRLGADSMIFVSGYDRVSKSGRKALIELAIADSSGTILYYSVKGSIQGNDLRDPASATAMVQELLAGFSRTEG